MVDMYSGIEGLFSLGGIEKQYKFAFIPNPVILRH